MTNGYMGKLLFVNLSTSEIKEETPDTSLYKNYIGGYGIGARILYDRQKPGADPLGPDNTLGFVTAAPTATPVPSGARYTVVTKSPLTGGWGDANSGGEFGPYIKFAGYDAVFFTGIAPKPVYLLIDNGKATLKDAAQWWGKDSYETEDGLMAEYGKDARVACIGPAGEKLSLISCIMTDRGSAAGRSGVGAVMGSKRLKAVVARGTLPVTLADKATLDKIRAEHIQGLRRPGPGGSMSFLERFHTYGTSSMSASSAHSGDSPVKNWGGVGVVDYPDRSGIDAEKVAASLSKRGGCWHCPIACKAYMKAGTGEFKYAEGSRRPEYETQASFGCNCLNTDGEAINMANDICNRYGMDTISAGTIIAFATECYSNGILTKKDTDGIELQWGNSHAMIAMTEKLAKREGIGDVLADGVKVAAAKIGKGAEQYAVHVGGQELGMHDPKMAGFGRGTPTAAKYQMDATPGRHTQGFGPTSFRGHANNAIGLCSFGMGFGTFPEPEKTQAEYYKAATGIEMTGADLIRAGERIATLRHAFNLREGVTELKWAVHPRIIGDPPQKAGPLAGTSADIKAQVYWNLGAMDWDMTTTKPSKKKLLELGLDDVAKDLWPPPPAK